MNLNHLMSQFLGSTNKATDPVEAPQSASRIVDAIPGGMLGGLAAGGIASLLVGNKGARKVAANIAGYGGAAAIGAIAFRAYDNWKHQRNEDTEIPAESNFHQHGLDCSGVAQHQFELAMVKIMVAAAKSDGHIDAEEQKKILGAVDSMRIDPEVKGLMFELLLRDIPLEEIDTANMALPLKTEMYLSACLIVGDLSDPETGFLKRLATHLALPAELVKQLDMQARQQLSHAA